MGKGFSIFPKSHPSVSLSLPKLQAAGRSKRQKAITWPEWSGVAADTYTSGPSQLNPVDQLVLGALTFDLTLRPPYFDVAKLVGARDSEQLG